MKAVSSGKSLSGEIEIPGSKSHTIRACIFAALADGESKILNPLDSQDCKAALDAICTLGANVRAEKDCWAIRGAGASLHLPQNVIDARNSGSVLYFFAPICAAMDGWSVFTGDEALRHRPVKPMLDALRQLGCEGHTLRQNVDAPPVLIKGPAKSGIVAAEGDFSQFISGIMIASSTMCGKTEIFLKNPKETSFYKMTGDWMKFLGASVQISPDFKKISVEGRHRYPAFERRIPADWGSAAFPIVAAAITDSEIAIRGIDMSHSQGDAEIAAILQKMGADIEIFEDDAKGHLGRLFVRGGAKSRLSNGGVLHGIRVNCAAFPDVVPALSVAACFAEGRTVIEDIAVCRHKETDRIAIMAKELSALGATISETPDSLAIEGCGKNSPQFKLHGGTVSGYGDHRVAMALSAFGLSLKQGQVEVCNAECCAVSFPDFYEKMNGLGAEIRLTN